MTAIPRGKTLVILMGLCLAVSMAATPGCGGDTGDTSAGPPPEEAEAAAVDPNAEVAVEPAPEAPPPEGPYLKATLYFADSAGQLRPEKRDIRLEADPARQAEAVVGELLAGPHGGLERTLPAGSRLVAVYVKADGTALVDMDSNFARGLAHGSEDALAAVWSITDSLGANVEAVRRVKVIVDGEEVRDLGGHLDLTRPLVPAVGYSARAVVPLPGPADSAEAS